MSCVIFGAGKIARGFLGHLLFLSGIDFLFVEKNETLAALINERGQYTVNILGSPEKNCMVRGARALTYTQKEEIADAVARADAVFTAVGGKNLRDVAPFLADGIRARAQIGGDALNVITCENWKQPASVLKEAATELLEGAALEFCREKIGFTEAVVMRSAIEPDPECLRKDPLAVNVQDYWQLPVDASRLTGPLPPVPELKKIEAFEGFLERKFYTYNAANGTVSYLGALLGYEHIADAAHDPRILEVLEGVYQETARALSAKHHFPLEEQLAFAGTSRAKLQDYNIVDSIERNARDPIRKLGPDDRLVGSARLAEEYGILPEHLCIAIAAAIYYTNDADPFALQLRTLREREGVDAVLTSVCGIDPSGQLGRLIREKIAMLKERGWIHG